MVSRCNNPSRRAVLRRLGAAVGLLAAQGLVGRPEALARQEKVSKASLQYRDHPNGHQQCAQCTHFIPAGNRGACQVVEGSISPHGWCFAFTPK